MKICHPFVKESSAMEEVLRRSLEYEGDWPLMREVLGAARIYRQSLIGAHRVRPDIPAGLAEAYALHVAGWGKPAREVLRRLLGLEEIECLYVLGGSIVESAWRYWLIRSRVVELSESVVWKTMVSLYPGRLADASNVELILYPVCRRLLVSLEGFWSYYSGEGAVRVLVAGREKPRRLVMCRRSGRGSEDLRAFCQECVQRLAEARGWERVPVVLTG